MRQRLKKTSPYTVTFKGQYELALADNIQKIAGSGSFSGLVKSILADYVFHYNLGRKVPNNPTPEVVHHDH